MAERKDGSCFYIEELSLVCKYVLAMNDIWMHEEEWGQLWRLLTLGKRGEGARTWILNVPWAVHKITL